MKTERINIRINKQVREKLKNVNKNEIIERLIFAATYKKEYGGNGYLESWGDLVNVYSNLPLNFIYTIRTFENYKKIIVDNLTAKEIRQILNIIAKINGSNDLII